MSSSTAAVSADQLMTTTTIAVAGIFFALAAYKSMFPLGMAKVSAAQADRDKVQAQQDDEEEVPPAKPPSASAVRVTYSTNRPEMTAHHAASGQDRPTIRAGALLRLIDVVAGVCARRHAGNSCVTVSIDAVLFLSPVYRGELLHLDASVNRAFGSSMEIGVRIEKEDAGTGERVYVAHSYLTFVALPRPPPSQDSSMGTSGHEGGGFSLKPALGVRVGSQARSNQHSATPKRVRLAPIEPQNMLQARRHLLAGRRRAARMRAAQTAATSSPGRSQSGVSAALRDEVRFMLQPASDAGHFAAQGSLAAISARQQAQRVEMVELELVTRAVAAGDPSVRIEPSAHPDEPAQVIVSLPGDQPIIHTLDEVRDCAKELGLRLPFDRRESLPPTPSSENGPPSADLWTDWRRRMSVVDGNIGMGLEGSSTSSFEHEIPVEQTLVQSLNLVFPQHANSVSVLFGGQLAEWLEETALLSVRHVRAGPWQTVAMDGLPFKEGVAIGEAMICYAVVTDFWIPPPTDTRFSINKDKSFTPPPSSPLAEVLVIAEAEAPDGSRRITNEALFTLRCDAPVSSMSSVTSIRMPLDSELARFAQGAARRRRERLDMGNMLVRLYSK